MLFIIITSITQAINEARKIPNNKILDPKIRLTPKNNFISPYPNISFFKTLSKIIVINKIKNEIAKLINLEIFDIPKVSLLFDKIKANIPNINKHTLIESGIINSLLSTINTIIKHPIINKIEMFSR